MCVQPVGRALFGVDDLDDRAGVKRAVLVAAGDHLARQRPRLRFRLLVGAGHHSILANTCSLSLPAPRKLLPVNGRKGLAENIVIRNTGVMQLFFFNDTATTEKIAKLNKRSAKRGWT